MIYMESGDDSTIEKAVFTYSTSFLATGKGSLREKDCKMCSRKELIKSFCSSDFGKYYATFKFSYRIYSFERINS